MKLLTLLLLLSTSIFSQSFQTNKIVLWVAEDSVNFKLTEEYEAVTFYNLNTTKDTLFEYVLDSFETVKYTLKPDENTSEYISFIGIREDEFTALITIYKGSSRITFAYYKDGKLKVYDYFLVEEISDMIYYLNTNV